MDFIHLLFEFALVFLRNGLNMFLVLRFHRFKLLLQFIIFLVKRIDLRFQLPYQLALLFL